ncbi:dUTP diphosphatase [Candidatus Poribacteria bacterium]|nr:dUTP diphosphatase [Candidatus Poribacteria bacterium]
MTGESAGHGAVLVQVEVLPHGEGLDLPFATTEWAAGCDVRAAVTEPVTIQPGGVALVPTGFKMAVPPGFEIQVRPRSGLAIRHMIGVLNSPGTIDADYRGEVQVILMNFGTEPFTVSRRDRIAQLVVARVEKAEWVRVAAVVPTRRGEGGFGSTGV